ncbi:hypothetical protein AbraIFM66950_007073 [Aspergillus brasiliensis]|nr:hypothetical protein AbraIFM66950_007073 [Aspergillus brasiliensis]
MQEKAKVPLADVTPDQGNGIYIDIPAMPSFGEQARGLWNSKRAVGAALACSSAATLVGYDLTLLGSIIANEQFIIQFGVYDPSLRQWALPAIRQTIWTIVQFISAVMGAVIVGYLSDRLGRLICLYGTVVLTIVGALVELFSPNWKIWVIGKLLMGCSMGFMQSTVPSCVSELAPVHMRGFLLSLFQFWIILGTFLAACVLEGTSTVDGPWSWKAAIASQFGISLICLLLLFCLVPESPYYLARQDRIESARKVLLILRGPELSYNADEDLATIVRTIEQEKQAAADSGSYTECFVGVDRRRTFVACLPIAMQQFMGFPLCGNYLSYFLELAGLKNSFLVQVISSLLSLFAILVAFTMIERVGRRLQLLVGCCMMLPCLLGLGILGLVNYGSAANGRGLSGLAIIWSIFYYFSCGAVGWTILGEVSSTRLRTKTSSIAVSVNALINMAWAIAVPYLINADEADLGPKSAFIFLGTGAILCVIAFFSVPETKGKTFEQLNYLFAQRTSARKF